MANEPAVSKAHLIGTSATYSHSNPGAGRALSLAECLPTHAPVAPVRHFPIAKAHTSDSWMLRRRDELSPTR